jgi:hypothetical protein
MESKGCPEENAGVSAEAKEGWVMRQPDNKVCDEYCQDCSYFYGSSDYELCCNYYLDTDKRRPCPPGTGCTVKVYRAGKRRFGKYSIVTANEESPKTQKNKVPVLKTCPVCGNEFLATRSDKKYCDSVCCVIANNRKTLEKIKAEREPRYRLCKLCGKEFMITNPNQQYCNEECKRKRKEIDHVKD